MPKCYQLIGVPGSGKSTWAHTTPEMQGIWTVSTDTLVEIHAHNVGKTYDEVFNDFMPEAVKLMLQEVQDAADMGVDIIWDQTNVSVNSRVKKFRMLPEYDHIAIVFKTPHPKDLEMRLASRPGKTIPRHVMISMIKSLQVPTLSEGFKEIRFAT